jgi:hypothetical protein
MKHLLIISILAALFVGLAGCSGDEGGSEDVTKNLPEQRTTADDTQPASNANANSQEPEEPL